MCLRLQQSITTKRSLTPYEWATFYIFFEDWLMSIQHYSLGELCLLSYSFFTFFTSLVASLAASIAPIMAAPALKIDSIITICI